MATDKRITELPAATTPLGGTEKAEIVQGGVNKQVDVSELGSGGTSTPYGATTGTNTYSATMSPVVSAYADGQMYHIRVGNSSTGLVTIDLGPGAKKAFDTSGAQIQDGYLKAGVDYVIVYNSTLDAAAGGFTVVNEVIHGFMNLRATYTTGTGLWPSTGGSGPSSGIRHGDTFIAGSNMTLGAKVVNTGDFITTMVDSPGQTDASWYVIPGFNSLASKVDEETFTTLTYGATVTWDTNNRQIPTAKLTATGNFTWDITNVKDGARGIVKLITNTASAIVMTFDATYTNKSLNTVMTSYTFPALTGQDYYLSWVLEGTTIEWVIGDISKTSAGVSLQRAANQVIASDAAVYTAVIFDTENLVNANMWTVSPNPTRIVIPGSGNKMAFVTGWVQWDASATGERRILINKNGASTAFTDGVFSRVIGTSSIPTIVSISGQINCVGGDYLEIMTFQNSTANRNVTASISVSVNDRA